MQTSMKPKEAQLSQERLKEVLLYDPNTGIFTRISPRQGSMLGGPAGAICDGYVKIHVDGSTYAAHRLAFLYQTGEWPTLCVDHIDGNPSNNAWNNLRQATQSQNLQNRRVRHDARSGLKGVTKHSDTLYTASISIKGTSTSLGCFKSAEAAHNAYLRAANDNFGEFASNGKHTEPVLIDPGAMRREKRAERARQEEQVNSLRIVPKACAMCGIKIPHEKKTCSNRCRMALSRARKVDPEKGKWVIDNPFVVSD